MLRKGDRLRVQGVGTPLPDDTECAWLSGSTPSGFPKRTCGMLLYPNSLREKHTALVNITPRRQLILSGYVVRIMTKVSKPSYSPHSAAILSRRPVQTSFTPCIPYLLMAMDFKASVLHVSELSITLPWIPKNSSQSRIALVIKKLSKHQNLTQFDQN